MCESIKPRHSSGFTVKTIWEHIIPLLETEQQSKLSEWENHDKKVLENFSNYLKAGLLNASPVMIELFIWYFTFEKQQKIKKVKSAELRYKRFIAYVKPKLEQSWLLWYFNAAVSTFEDVCEKIEGVSIDDIEYKWNSLKTLTSPAAFASGQTGNRKRLITGFNSPFYPNVLAATSVF